MKLHCAKCVVLLISSLLCRLRLNAYVETVSLGKILYMTCPELISTLSNSSSSSHSTSSASDGWFSEHKSVRLPRRMIASKRWRSAAVVKPHHALAAYVSLAVMIALKTTCSDAFAMSCARRSRRAWQVCADNLIMLHTRSATNSLLKIVTPTIFNDWTRGKLGRGGGCTGYRFRLLS